MNSILIIIIVAFVHVALSVFNLCVASSVFNRCISYYILSEISWILSFVLCLIIIFTFFFNKHSTISNFQFNENSELQSYLQDYILSKKQKKILDRLKREMKHKPLTFIHIPKCAGTFVRNFLPKINDTKDKSLQIRYKGKHEKASIEDVPAIAIIRHPIERFESMLRYRLDRIENHADLQQILEHLKLLQKQVTLNNIVEQMTNEQILNISPFQSLSYYQDNVAFMFTIDKFIPVLDYLGFSTKDIQMELKINTTTISDYQELSAENKKRIRQLYKDDLKLYRKWTRM